MVKLFSKRSANIKYVYMCRSLFTNSFKKIQHTCCESCSVVPIWVVSLYQMTWACGSACTTQINWASWPTPVCTNGRSTSISGGSINNRHKKLNQWHPMYHSSCVLFWWFARKCSIEFSDLWFENANCECQYEHANICMYVYICINTAVENSIFMFSALQYMIQHHIHTKQIIQRQCRRKMVDYLMSFSSH